MKTPEDKAKELYPMEMIGGGITKSIRQFQQNAFIIGVQYASQFKPSASLGEKPDFEKIATEMYCDENDMHDVKDTPDGIRVIQRAIKSRVASMERIWKDSVLPLQSQLSEKDKQIEELKQSVDRKHRIAVDEKVKVEELLEVLKSIEIDLYHLATAGDSELALHSHSQVRSLLQKHESK